MAEKTRSSTMSRFLRTVALLVDLAAVCALVLTAYAGMVSPLSHSAWWGVLPWDFPSHSGA